MIFSDKILQHLGVLYRHERHNAYVYSKVYNFLDVMGYKNIAKYYLEWSNHENTHAELVLDFANTNNIHIDMSIPIDPLDIDLINLPISHFATLTLDVENETTELYNQFLEMGEEDNNTFVRRFSLDFILEQMEETDKANTIKDRINNIGNDKALLQLFDNTFEA